MTFKPGSQNPTLPKWQRPKWHSAEKNEDGLPIAPKKGTQAEPPPQQGFVEVAPGTAVQEPEKLPNKRGKGGRPTKAQARDEGKLKGAQAAIEEVREVHPPQKPVSLAPKNQRQWEKEFVSHEQEIERKEAEAVLAYREDKLAAINEETLIRRASRKAAMGFGSVSLRLVSVMDAATRKLEEKVKNTPADHFTVKDLQGVISTAGATIQRASASMEVAARLERLWMRSPLESEENGDTDDQIVSAEEAKIKLENVMKSLAAYGQRRNIKVLEAEIVDEAPIEKADEV